ncbi:unnamed protein product [Darwinula stevensoni]|uniref:Uncharacterized protein n=1 Tax=Darwinula stevensoni TaxID=69355 RepID=A0A7R8X6M4_9CRUS|nr:unnamed protein product [Darwinula stevensoni]CAG0881632.1 unnamed protein product [Darwinula stevensoni]
MRKMAESEWVEMGEGRKKFHVNPVDDQNLDLDAQHSQERSVNGIPLTSTYDTRYLKSLRHLTREVFPREYHYRNMQSIEAEYQRPTLDELHAATVVHKPKELDPPEEEGPRKGVIKFGWLEGVFMRCLLNIWGVMLFLRLSWVMGQAGISESLLLEGLTIITLSNIVTIITSISMSAVSTNGQIKGGGIYYMISRSLGPQFGGAIGLMFTIANSVACAMYVIGFCDSLQDLLKYEFDGAKIVDGGDNDTRIIGVCTIIVIIGIAFVGMDWVTRTQVILLVVLVASQVDFIVGSFLEPSDEARAKGFVGYSAEVAKRNLYSKYGPSGISPKDQDYFSVFAVFFPAVTGIVAGANLSGDLKNPSSAIPKGTLGAVFLTYLTYVGYGAMIATCTVRDATGDVRDLGNASLLDAPAYNCTARDCDWGIRNNGQMMTLIAAWSPLIYGGCFAATLSSAIASLVGAPRALAKDKLYPGIYFFSVGHGANNDPMRGYLACFVLAVACILVVAALQVNFMLAAYGLINFSVFHASTTKSPGWRPSFKFYNAWVSLLGTLLCVVVMFMIQWEVALATFGVTMALYLYVSYRKPDANWGSSTQAQVYTKALKGVHDLNKTAEHVKNYRPQLLVLSGPPSARPPLLDFVNLITKTSSLLVVGNIVKGPLKHAVRNNILRQGYSWLYRHKIKSFYNVVEEDNFESGAKALLQLTGLGKLRPNMLVLGYKTDWQKVDPIDTLLYFNAIHVAFDNNLALGILRVQEGLDYSGIVEEDPKLVEKTEVLLKPLAESEGKNESKIENCHEAGCRKESHFSSVFAQKRRLSRRLSQSHVYRGPGGAALPKSVLSSLTRFQQKQKGGRMDVWWLYDDGGLTILLPYILNKRAQFSSASLRIFSLTSTKGELEHEQRSMAALLSKFRIDYSDVVVIPDVQKKAARETRQEFRALVEPFMEKANENRAEGSYISETELTANEERNNRHMRLRELLLHHSLDAALIVMTLPMPRKGIVSAPLYMAWLETLTEGMPPFLLVRGNQTSVMTFYH